MKQLGRCRWKQASGYHRQGWVENAFFRYKFIIGDGLRARSPARQGSEAVLDCEILNRMTALGRRAGNVPLSDRASEYRISALRASISIAGAGCRFHGTASPTAREAVGVRHRAFSTARYQTVLLSRPKIIRRT